MPPLPKKRSTRPVILTTKYTHNIFRIKAITILILAYSARKESNVVNAPAPASRGNTKGTSVASFIGPWFLKISTSRIISKDIRKITNAPATAKDSISTWNSFSIKSPA